MGGQDLLFDTPGRQHEPTQSDLSRHRPATINGAPGGGGHERRGQGHARGGTVLGHRPGWNVQVDVVRVEESDGRPSYSARLRVFVIAARADSCMTSPS